MTLRICIVIPTYNNPASIAQVTSEVLEQTKYSVLIVDDGSEIPVRQLMTTSLLVSSLESGRLQILRLDENAGKGIALQRAIQKTLELGFTHLLSMDGDGQHLTSEIAKLVQVAQKNPWSLVIGARKMHGETVPQVSKFGRAFSNFWVQFQTEKEISDSQSGFRLYPLFFLQHMKFWCKRYDFEIEVLIRLMWKGVEILEAEIDVFYPEKDKRISHFNKLWDNVRISLLNTVLVVLSLLNSRKSPAQTGLAVGTGVLIGCTPFFGFHTFLCLVFSFFFRLNAIFLWLGSQISNPPMLPFIILGSIWIGNQLVSGPNLQSLSFQELSHLPFRDLLHLAEQSFKPWVVGSIVFGSSLGAVTGTLSGLLARKMQTKKKAKPTWNGRTRGGTIGNGFLKLVLKFVGLRAGYFCLYFIIPYFYLFAPKGRKSLNEYWRLMRPAQNAFSRQFTVMKHFFRFGQVLMDTIFKNVHPKAQFQTRPHGIEHILQAAEAKRGLILVSAHAGAWSLAASLLDHDGFRQEFYVVQYEASGNSFNKVRGETREEHLKKFHVHQGSPSIFDIHVALNHGQTIGIMGDRPLGNRYELVQFFGKLAPFDVTPYRLAATLKVPLLFSFGFKSEATTYDFFATEPRMYQYEPGIDPQTQCVKWAQEFALILEAHLRKYPHQWFNFYPFWSSLPAAPPSEKTETGPPH